MADGAHGEKPTSLGRGLSRQYSLYPQKPSLKSIRGIFGFAFDTIKLLYTNEITRCVCVCVTVNLVITAIHLSPDKIVYIMYNNCIT